MARVLIWDPNAEHRETIARDLHGAAHYVQEVADESGALAMASSYNWDVLLADFSRSPRDGTAVARLHRAMPEAAIIEMSPSPSIEGALEACRAGASDYRATPLAAGLARQAVGDALSHQRAFDARTVKLRQLARAVEQSPVSVIITDTAGRIEFINAAFTKTTGYTLGDVRGQTPRVLKSGETPAADYAALWSALTSGAEWHGEFHNRRKDGSLFWESASLSAIRDDDGTITHYLAVKQDITLVKELEMRLLQAQRVEGIGRLASGIAHDLNNVFTPIMMAAQMIPACNDASALTELADTVQESAKRGADIARQLLSFAKGSAQGSRPVSVSAIVDSMARLCRRTFPSAITVHDQCDPGLWQVSADPTRLEQVLLNLCINARDAMPSGGRLSITASNHPEKDAGAVGSLLQASGPYVELQVIDTGTGIADAARARVFEPFFTTKAPEEGSGLGLDTVRRIVSGLGGGVSFETAVGKGTAFSVVLPALAPQLIA